MSSRRFARDAVRQNEDTNTIHDLAGRMLAAFLASDLSESPGVVIGIEESFRESIVPGRPDFLGIVDMLFKPGEALVIRDYKTSRSRWNQGTAESSADQLLMYSELAKSLLPEFEIKLEFVVITKTKSPAVERFQIVADRKRIERTQQVSGRTLDAIDAGVFYPNQSALNCSTCPYRSACGAWQVYQIT